VGKIGAAILLTLFATISIVAISILSMLDWYASLGPVMQTAVFGGAMLAGGAAILCLASVLIDRSVKDLRRFMQNAIDPAGEESPAATPHMMTPVRSAVQAGVKAVLTREQQLKEELGDLRIAHRIMETERNQLHGVLHALRDAVIVTDAFDEVVTMNAAAAEALSLSAEFAARKPIDAIMKDRRLIQLIREVRESGNLAETRCVEHDVVSDSDSIPYEITLSLLANKRMEVGAVVTILHDLRREREVAQMKSDFVSKASHELRTPLSSIRAYVEMLVDGEATDEQSRREFYDIIQNEADRLSRMIDNMLNISRIEAGIIQIDRIAVDFRTLLSRAAETLEPQAGEKRIGLSVKAAPVDLTAEGDEDMLYQVVLNLLSNAIKYTPEGGRIALAADTDNLTRSIVVTVTDTGLGIPPDSLPRLFEKFYRIESFKRVAKGTGLGLNLCKHIVETVHHGQIGVESKLGMGSKFWFTVPMRFAGAQAA